MKINTSRSRAKSAMRYLGNTKNRPEQILAATLLKMHLPLWCHVDTEVEARLYDPDNPNVPYERTIDIAVRNMQQKFAIELNGPPHDEQLQMRKDNRRKIIFEWKGNDYKYIVFDYKKMENLFIKAERDIILEEAVNAYEEIKAAIEDTLPLGDCRKNQIETMLRKTQVQQSDQVS